MLDKADKQIRTLDRSVKGALYEFQYKFRDNPDAPGLNLERLRNTQLFSARVTNDYRALLLHLGERDYVLVAVKAHKDVYEHLDRYRYQINPVSGGIEFIDLQVAESTVAEASSPDAVGRSVGAEPLFASYSNEQLLELGVAEPLLPLLAKIVTEEELNALLSLAPRLSAEVLYELYLGTPPGDIAEQVTGPATADEPVEPEDYQSAVARPSTAVTDDVDLQSVIDDPFADWRVYLHPSQRRLVTREYSGPARVSGGPGTGKTVVALHRVKHLALRTTNPEERILLTTFTTNLAADLRHRLTHLGDFSNRIDVINIDKLAGQVIAETAVSGPRRMLSDTDAVSQWRWLLRDLGETGWDPRFLHEEWTQVILGQAINERAEYFRARRAGRGAKLGRAQRAGIWRLVERFTQRLDERGMGTFAQVAEQAARLERERAEAGLHRYRHVVIDEAQDLSPAHWKMLRAMAPNGPDDLFITGDPHQRIYQHQVALGSLGVNIRGRSSRLTVSYRTTRQILGTAIRVLGEESWDDLDDGTDNLRGYRTLLHGERPELCAVDRWTDELELITNRVQAWYDSAEPSAIGVCVPERSMVKDVLTRLEAAGIPRAEIRSSGVGDTEAVHVGTMHRFKGLEYRQMIIAGIADGKVPPSWLKPFQTSDPAYFERETKRYRSLLFVAATRARDTLTISWHGTRSPFLRSDGGGKG